MGIKVHFSKFLYQYGYSNSTVLLNPDISTIGGPSVVDYENVSRVASGLLGTNQIRNDKDFEPSHPPCNQILFTPAAKRYSHLPLYDMK